MKYKLKPGDTSEVSKGIFIKGDRVLLVKPSIGNTNKYDIPGGKIKLGESKEQGLYRECLEEIGLKIRKVKFLGREKNRKKNYFIISEWNGDIVLQEEEISKYRWVPVVDTLQYNLTKTAFDGITMYLKTI
jgi:8-oxo-dGTP pyrophosphatase MutT (NUDIX family)